MHLQLSIIFNNLNAINRPQGRQVRDAGFVSSSTSSQWTQHVLDDLYDATAFTTGRISGDESDDTSMMGTKDDKKDFITSTATFLAQGNFNISIRY